MTRFAVVLGLILSLFDARDTFAASRGGAHSSGGTVHVHGYNRKDGTYVAPYTRHAPGTATQAPGREPRIITPDPGTARTNAPEPKRVNLPSIGPDSLTRESHIYRAHLSSGFIGARDAHGKIVRSEAAKREFMRMTGFPHGRPGYVVDHIIPLKRNGPDSPSNMQWQTVAEAKAKDRWE